jgi:hypothetical protein
MPNGPSLIRVWSASEMVASPTGIFVNLSGACRFSIGRMSAYAFLIRTRWQNTRKDVVVAALALASSYCH